MTRLDRTPSGRLRYYLSLQRDGALRAGTRPFRQRARDRWMSFTARRARRRSRSTFIGVTGSSAKSTTTCLLGHLLEGHGSVYLQARRNTIRPVTSTARAGKESIDYVVSELGVAQPGDMQAMARILQPDVAIVTFIGLDHKSAFGDREAIAREKGALVEAIRPGGFALLNADDDLVMSMADRTRARVVTFGRDRDADYRVVSATSAYPDPLSVEIVWLGGRIRIHTRLLGEHFWLSAVAAFAAATELGVAAETIRERCATFQPVQNRCTPFATEGGPVFLLDAAKAPWETLPLAIRVVEQAVAPRKRIVIGQISDYFGNPSGKYRDAYRAARSASDQVIFAGENAHRSKASPEDRESGRFIELRTAREVHQHIESTAVRGEVILLKSSRNLHLERVALAWKHEVRCWIDRCGVPKDCFDCGLYETPFEEHGRILTERAATARRRMWKRRLMRLLPWRYLGRADGDRGRLVRRADIDTKDTAPGGGRDAAPQLASHSAQRAAPSRVHSVQPMSEALDRHGNEMTAGAKTRGVKTSAAAPAFTVRPWRPADDPALVAILRAHMEVDPGWPPAYAREGDLGEWLGAPATLGRWVAVDSREEPVGHVGIGPVAPGEAAELWTGFLGCDIAALAEVCRNLVEPRMRRAGVSAALTRVALRAAIDAGRVPVATVLHDRHASLAMMLSAGWRSVGNVTGRSGQELSVMIPGPRVIEAAKAGRAA